MDKFGKFLQGNTGKLIVGIGALAFNVVFWVIVAVAVKLENTHATLWWGYGFAMFSFLPLLGVMFIPIKNRLSGHVLNGLYGVTALYMGLTFVMNLIFMIVNTDHQGGFVTQIVLNVLLLLAYIALAFIFIKRFSKVQANDIKREEQMRDLKLVFTKVSAVSNQAEDPEVKAELIKLRQRVNNSSSAGNEHTQEYDKQFEDQINVVQDMLNANVEKEEVLKAIKVANNILTTRNQILLSTR